MNVVICGIFYKSHHDSLTYQICMRNVFGSHPQERKNLYLQLQAEDKRQGFGRIICGRGPDEFLNKDSPSTKYLRPSHMAGERLEDRATFFRYDGKLSLKRMNHKLANGMNMRIYYPNLYFPRKGLKFYISMFFHKSGHANEQLIYQLITTINPSHLLQEFS